VADVAEEQRLGAIQIGEGLGALALMLLRPRIGDGGLELTGDERMEGPGLLQWAHRVGTSDQHTGEALAAETRDRQGDRTLWRDLGGAHGAANQYLGIVDEHRRATGGNGRHRPGVVAASQVDGRRDAAGNGLEPGAATQVSLRTVDQIQEGERQIARVARESRGCRLACGARGFREAALRS
jgi:hypothetical protein